MANITKEKGRTVGTATNQAVGTTAVTVTFVRDTIVQNNGSNTIYFGSNSDVATTTGFPLVSNASFKFAGGQTVYFRAAAGGEDLRILPLLD